VNNQGKGAVRLNERKIKHHMKQSLQFKPTLLMPRRNHNKQASQFNKELATSNSLEDFTSVSKNSQTSLVEAPAKTNSDELKAQKKSKSNSHYQNNHYYIKREGESALDFSTRLVAHIDANTNRIRKERKQLERRQSAIIDDQDTGMSIGFHNSSTNKVTPLIETISTRETPCNNNQELSSETIESVERFIDDPEDGNDIIDDPMKK
jgi:hypothetical protein